MKGNFSLLLEVSLLRSFLFVGLRSVRACACETSPSLCTMCLLTRHISRAGRRGRELQEVRCPEDGP